MAQVSINFYSGTTCLIPKIIEIQFIMVVRYNVFIIILSYKKVAQEYILSKNLWIQLNIYCYII